MQLVCSGAASVACQTQPPPPPRAPFSDTVLRAGQLHSLIRELCSYYISLEEFYMEESVSKAMRIDETAAGNLTSTMVEDVFFILQKCSQRALASGRVMSIAAVCSHSNILLSSVYKEALASKLQV